MQEIQQLKMAQNIECIFQWQSLKYFTEISHTLTHLLNQLVDYKGQSSQEGYTTKLSWWLNLYMEVFYIQLLALLKWVTCISIPTVTKK